MKSFVTRQCLALALGAGLFAAPAAAADITIQPMHVFALWQNVNECLVTTVRTTSTKMVLISAIRDMEPVAFEGKSPADIYERTAVVRAKIERLRSKLGQQPWHEAHELGDHEVQQMHTYLVAGMALDGIASLMVAKTGPEQAVSVCYKDELIDGKTANDVYTMVDLADRRLDAVLEAYGA